FDPSTLVYWRKRIAKSQRPERVFDAVAEVIGQTGVLRGRRKRVIDSTVLDDAVATQDTVTQLTSAIRKVARVVPGAGEVIGAVCRLDYSRPGKPVIDWDDPAAKHALVSDLVNDAVAVLAGLTGDGAPQRDEQAAERRAGVWRSTATRTTARARPARTTRRPGTPPSSSPCRCARRCPAGSPSMTSSSMSSRAR